MVRLFLLLLFGVSISQKVCNIDNPVVCGFRGLPSCIAYNGHRYIRANVY